MHICVKSKLHLALMSAKGSNLPSKFKVTKGRGWSPTLQRWCMGPASDCNINLLIEDNTSVSLECIFIVCFCDTGIYTVPSYWNALLGYPPEAHRSLI